MQIITDAQLLEKVEAFLTLHDMAPSQFGRDAMGDAALVFQLRGETAGGKQFPKARSLSLANARKVIEFMESYRPESRAA